MNSLSTISGRQLGEEEEELAKMQVKALAMVIGKTFVLNLCVILGSVN